MPTLASTEQIALAVLLAICAFVALLLVNKIVEQSREPERTKEARSAEVDILGSQEGSSVSDSPVSPPTTFATSAVAVSSTMHNSNITASTPDITATPTVSSGTSSDYNITPTVTAERQSTPPKTGSDKFGFIRKFESL